MVDICRMVAEDRFIWRLMRPVEGLTGACKRMQDSVKSKLGSAASASQK